MTNVNPERQTSKTVTPARTGAMTWGADRADPPKKAHADSIAAKARDFAMVRIGALCGASWLAAAVLYFGRHSVALMALSGVIALAGFDLARPD
jgi:hypothetical protein